ncbi:MAG: hypothetical protein ABR589_08430 [Chthoniobacterales bacterium]
MWPQPEGMPNFGYHLARAEGGALRRLYAALVPSIVRRKLRPPVDLPFEVYAYSGESALPEQIASIRSFLRYAGRPAKYVVVSDGTYTARSAALLRAIDSVVSVSQSADWMPSGSPAELQPYLTAHPTGKQLALIMSLPMNEPALYVDSDVLFFPGAATLSSLGSADDKTPARYLADCQLSADERLLRDLAEQREPVNTGVLFLYRKLDWSDAIARFLELPGPPNFFTNQTMTHLAMHANGAKPFDPRKFVLQLDDQFVYADRYAGPDLVLRHYVNPVRHKFWTAQWR